MKAALLLLIATSFNLFASPCFEKEKQGEISKYVNKCREHLKNQKDSFEKYYFEAEVIESELVSKKYKTYISAQKDAKRLYSFLSSALRKKALKIQPSNSEKRTVRDLLIVKSLQYAFLNSSINNVSDEYPELSKELDSVIENRAFPQELMEGFVVLGIRYFKAQGKFKNANYFLGKAAVLWPKVAKAWLLEKAILEAEQDRFQSSLKVLTKGGALQSEYFNTIAILAKKKGFYQDSLDSYYLSLKVEKDPVTRLMILGEIAFLYNTLEQEDSKKRVVSQFKSELKNTKIDKKRQNSITLLEKSLLTL